MPGIMTSLIKIRAQIIGCSYSLFRMIEGRGEVAEKWDEQVLRIGETMPMRKPAQYLIAEVPRSLTKVGMTIGIDLGDVWSHYCTLTALTYVLTLGSKERFERSRDVGCYLGLRPRRSQSGDHDPQLGITKAGKAIVGSFGGASSRAQEVPLPVILISNESSRQRITLEQKSSAGTACRDSFTEESFSG
jgi:Transposase IS116/IS110/IS902 family